MSIVALADVLTYLGKGSTATDAELGLLNMMIPLAEGALRTFIGYNPEYLQHVELYPERDQFAASDVFYLEKVGTKVVLGPYQNDSRYLLLRHLPVRFISSVYEDPNNLGSSDFQANTLLTNYQDYYLDVGQSGYSTTGILIRTGSMWSYLRRTVKVTYTSGFTPAEFDGTAESGIDAQGLKFAAIIAVIAAFQEARGWQDGGTYSGPLKAESISTSGHNKTYGDTLLTQGLMVSLPPKSRQLAQPFRRYAL